MTNRIAISREQEIFVTLETVRGTLAPPAASGFIVAAGDGSIRQQPSFTNSSEIRNSRDILDRFQDRTPPGDWSFSVYASPSGSKGVAPQEDTLMTCLFGTKTVNAATSVVYTLNTIKPSFSLWMKKSHTVFHASGATVGNGKTALATKDGTKIDFSGKFMKMGWAGTTVTAATVSSAATTFTVAADEEKKYTIGAMIEFVESDVAKNNSAAGYTITDINYSTHTISFSPGAEEEITSGSTVRGWLPTGTKVGIPLESRKGIAALDGTNFPVQSMDITIADDPKYLEDEITESGYTEDYAEDERNVSGTIAVYFRQDDVGYFYDGLNNEERALKMIVGNVAGNILEFEMTRTSLSVPDIANSSPTLALNMPYMALGTDGEDSITATYK